MSESIIGVDLGGTQMRVARFDSALNLVERLAEPTQATEGPDRVVARLLDLIQPLHLWLALNTKHDV